MLPLPCNGRPTAILQPVLPHQDSCSSYSKCVAYTYGIVAVHRREHDRVCYLHGVGLVQGQEPPGWGYSSGQLGATNDIRKVRRHSQFKCFVEGKGTHLANLAVVWANAHTRCSLAQAATSFRAAMRAGDHDEWPAIF